LNASTSEAENLGLLGHLRWRPRIRCASLGKQPRDPPPVGLAQTAFFGGVLAAFQQGEESVLGAEGEVDDLGGDRHLPLAQEVEDMLQVVRKPLQLVEPEHRAVALDRVQGPKGPCHEFTVVRPARR